MVNLELYKVFYTVAKCGSLTKAAEELYISQPAVSQGIKQLETQLGGKLFNRTHRGMELTETGGKQFFGAVEQALKILDEAEKKYSEFKNSATGVISICAADTVSTHFLLKYVKEYNEKYPGVKFIMQNCTSQESIEYVKNKRADMGFVNLPIDDDGVDLSDMVMQLHDVFVASDKFEELFEGVIELGRLQKYPLLMLQLSTSTRQAIVSFAHSQDIHLHPEMELGSLKLMIEFAKAGLGIACIPREFIGQELASGVLHEIKTYPELPIRGVGLILPKNSVQSYATKEFLALIKGE